MLGKHFSLWADERLADASDLVAAVLADHSTPDDKLPEIAGLMGQIQQADEVLAATFRDRKSA